MLKSRLRQPETERCWPCPEGMHPILHRLLLTRGVSSDEEARMFMHPGREMLRDPFLMNDMHAAVDIIRDAVEKKESICVYGDYDVDGVCASAILTLYLKELGADCDVYLPSRHTEGYGLNADAVDQISKRFQLLITVDCGITAFDLVERAKQEGMRVIVTDHHRPDELLPDCPTVNPLLGGYPFGYLCGTGVTFQLVSALAGREKAMEYIDLAALATIADIVPLRDENRAIACLGLKKINLSARPGVRALISISGLEDKKITAANVAFQMTPRMNASGRMGDAKRAYDLMTSADIERCEALALELDEENRSRKEFENKAIEEAERQLEQFDFTGKSVLFVQGDDWNPGVIGLAASRLTEKYHYPTVALTRDGETDSYIGSCRSIDGINIHEALTHTAPLLERFGGHKMAAGLKVSAANLETFKQQLDSYIGSAYASDLWIPVIEYDAELDGAELTEELTRQVEELAPTGCGNPGAVFKTRGNLSEAYPVGREKEHLKLTLRCADGTRMPGIWFRHSEDADLLSSDADVFYSPSVNEYMGRTNVQADVKMILPVGASGREQTAPERFSAFAADLMREFGVGEDYAPVTPTDVKTAFSACHKGNLVIAADPDSARIVLGAAGGLTDVFFGHFPEDRRCFNAVCIAPSGRIPDGYQKVFYAGVPDAFCSRGARISGIPACASFGDLPELAGLRDICRAVKEKAGQVFEGPAALAGTIAKERNLPLAACTLGICVLVHMGTARFEAGCLSYDATPRNPATDNLYSYLSGQRGCMA